MKSAVFLLSASLALVSAAPQIVPTPTEAFATVEQSDPAPTCGPCLNSCLVACPPKKVCICPAVCDPKYECKLEKRAAAIPIRGTTTVTKWTTLPTITVTPRISDLITSHFPTSTSVVPLPSVITPSTTKVIPLPTVIKAQNVEVKDPVVPLPSVITSTTTKVIPLPTVIEPVKPDSEKRDVSVKDPVVPLPSVITSTTTKVIPLPTVIGKREEVVPLPSVIPCGCLNDCVVQCPPNKVCQCTDHCDPKYACEKTVTVTSTTALKTITAADPIKTGQPVIEY